MDDFMGFMRQASQTPLLAAALIGESLLAVWKQLLCAGIVVGGSVVIWRRARKKQQSPRIEWHELLAKPVPHKAPVNCKCTMEPLVTPTEDEDVFTEWHKALIGSSGITFSKDEARKLYAANTRHRVGVTR